MTLLLGRPTLWSSRRRCRTHSRRCTDLALEQSVSGYHSAWLCACAMRRSSTRDHARNRRPERKLGTMYRPPKTSPRPSGCSRTAFGRNYKPALLFGLDSLDTTQHAARCNDRVGLSSLWTHSPAGAGLHPFNASCSKLLLFEVFSAILV